MNKLIFQIAFFFLLCISVSAQNNQVTTLDLQNRGFFFGREYFMVRSGAFQWLVQTDRADLGPAVTGYLFDADSITKNTKKDSYNYNPTTGVKSSALEVVSAKSNYAFTAFGEQTRVRWINIDNVPTIDATWWANGVRVNERFSGLFDKNTIRRSISLTGADLYGEEQVFLRLYLPESNAIAANRSLFVKHKDCFQSLIVGGKESVRLDEKNGLIEIGPIKLVPHQTVVVETYLFAALANPKITPDYFSRQIDSIANRATQYAAETCAKWNSTSKIETKDTLVQQMFDITKSVLPSIISAKGVMRTGPFQYGAEWIRDASQFSLGLTSSGYFEQAHALLEHCLRDMLNAEGKTMICGEFNNPDMEQFDQTGELILALRWYSDFSGDYSLVETYRNKLIALVERPLKYNFRDSTGLVHNRREFWEQSMNDAYELSYNTYVAVGLEEAAVLADHLGVPEKKNSWLKEAETIKKTILKILVHDSTFIKRRNITGDIANYLTNERGAPDVPCKSAVHHLIYPDATMALPIIFGLVKPNSPLVVNTLNQLEQLHNERWFGGGYDRYNSSSEINMPGPWGIAGALIMRGQHTGGMLERSRQTLEWFRNVQGGNSGLYYEQIPLIAKSQQNWLGLVSWPSGEIPYFFVRNYLGISFEKDSIRICPQLYPNSPSVQANLRFRKGRLKVEIDGSGPVIRAKLDGKTIPVSKDGAIKLPINVNGERLVLHAGK